MALRRSSRLSSSSPATVKQLPPRARLTTTNSSSSSSLSSLASADTALSPSPSPQPLISSRTRTKRRRIDYADPYSDLESTHDSDGLEPLFLAPDSSSSSEDVEEDDDDSESSPILSNAHVSHTHLPTVAEFPADSSLADPVPQPVRRPRRRLRVPSDEEETRFMSTKEKWAFRAQKKVDTHHPELINAWDELPVRGTPPPVDPPRFLKLKLLPYQLDGLAWLVRQERDNLGILLADEMGMGKTISMIALMLANRQTPTLIVAPTVAIKQWIDEMARHIEPEGQFKILMFHGSNRKNVERELLAHDIVITSYAVIESAFRKMNTGFRRKAGVVKEPSALHTVQWARVILDESHTIKDRSTNTARAVFNLNCVSKCALSGTPITNRVGEFYSVLKFMQIDPMAYYFCRSCPCKSITWKFTDHRYCDDCGHITQQHFCYWNYEILKPIQDNGAAGKGLVAFEKLGKLLDLIMLRRTKLEKADDLCLPPRHVVVRRDYFSQDEHDFYSSLYSDSRRQFATYVAEGTVLNHYASIFELITRMRQASIHPCMVTSKHVHRDGRSDALICGICHEPAEDPVTAKCRHTFCRQDVAQYVEGYGEGANVKCPVCYVKLVVDLDGDVVDVSMSAVQTKLVTPRNSSFISRLDMNQWRSSTKIEALVEELTNLKRLDHTIKSLVFSQFTSALTLVAWRLKRAGFNVVHLDGRMSLTQRDTAVQMFMSDPLITVFLVSLKAGGIALNLTEASQVFLLDPWWNSSVQDQAIDRIHRLGQHRPIRITHIIIEDSIEERIIQLQEKKKALIESTIGKDSGALAKLSEEDLQFLFVM